MRNAFAAEINALAGEGQRVMLLRGDIRNRLFHDRQLRAHGRFFNCGVAEVTQIGVAAGMAMCGLRPVAYSITPFVTTRCLEQIRVDVCYHHVPVIIVGTGSGLSYASLGATHHSCEDIAFMRCLPHMTVVCPADPVEARQAVRAAGVRGAGLHPPGQEGRERSCTGAAAVRHRQGDRQSARGRKAACSAPGICCPWPCARRKRSAAKGSTPGSSVPHRQALDEALRRGLALSGGRHLIESTASWAGWAARRRMAGRSAGAAGPPCKRVGRPTMFLHEAGDQEYAQRRSARRRSHSTISGLGGAGGWVGGGGPERGGPAGWCTAMLGDCEQSMLIGVDFDNTIVCYDELFHRVAVEQGLMPSSVPATKGEVRRYLAGRGLGDVWTDARLCPWGPHVGARHSRGS
jgi:hypothetical protein